MIKTDPGGKSILLVGVGLENGLSFPKGHVKPNETPKEAAKREVREETGLQDLTIIKKLGIITRKSTEFTGEVVVKDIHLYLMKSEKFKQLNPEEKCELVLLKNASQRMEFKDESDFLLKCNDDL